jgi:hypothetical protein
MDEIIEGWRIIHRPEIYNLYSSSDAVRVINKIRVVCTGLVMSLDEQEFIHN